MQRFYLSILWPETYALVHLSFVKTTAFVSRRVLWPKSFLIFIVWMNWRTLQPTSFSSWSVNHVLGSMYRLVSHVLEAVHWKREIVTIEQVMQTSIDTLWDPTKILEYDANLNQHALRLNKNIGKLAQES